MVGFRTECTPRCVVASNVLFAVSRWVPHHQASIWGLSGLPLLDVLRTLTLTGFLPLDSILGVGVLTLLANANPKSMAACSPWGSVCNAAIMLLFPHFIGLSISLPDESVIDSSWDSNHVVLGSHSGSSTVISILKSGSDPSVYQGCYILFHFAQTYKGKV